MTTTSAKDGASASELVTRKTKPVTICEIAIRKTDRVRGDIKGIAVDTFDSHNQIEPETTRDDENK